MKILRKIIRFEITDEFKGLASGIFTEAIAVLGFLATLSYRDNTYSMSVIGPVTVPRFVCLAILLLGVLQIIKWAAARKGAPKAEKSSVDQNAPLDKMQIVRKITPLCSFLLIAAYIWLMKAIGFTMGSVVYLTLQIPLLSVDFSGRRFLKSFILAVIVSAVVFVLFAKGFQLHLPTGPWGF